MVYKWPGSLLQKIEVAFGNYLWTGDITKKGFSDVDRKRCCAPLDEGGFKIRSVCLANASFCKLTRNLLTVDDEQSKFLRSRYFHDDG